MPLYLSKDGALNLYGILSDDDEFGKAEERDRKVDALTEKIRAMECQNSLGFDVSNMGLVDGLRIPYKFKVPSFDKYNGTSCPRTHVQAYYRKISAYTDDEKMWMYFFQDSLSGASLDWYMDLRKEFVRSWRELGEAFLRQYKHNMDMAPAEPSCRVCFKRLVRVSRNTPRGGVN